MNRLPFQQLQHVTASASQATAHNPNNMEWREPQRRKSMPHNRQQNRIQGLVVREFELADEDEVQRIFYEGMMEMIPDTAFRALRYHPESLLLYASATVLCLVVTMCWAVIVLVPLLILCGRYFYSTRVINGFLKHSLNTDMGDIEGYYTKSADSRMWVAVLDGRVVGLVAALKWPGPPGSVELRRMSVDGRIRRCGVGVALGQKLLEFAAAHGYSTVQLGTTAYQPAAHRLYQRLGFRQVAITEGYTTLGSERSLMERFFYRVKIHHYKLEVQNSKIKSNQQ